MPSPTRILIYRLGSLGDGLVALPTLRSIRRHSPEANITVLTNRPVSDRAAPLEDVLGGEGIANDYLYHSIPLRDRREITTLFSDIRQGAFDAIITLAAARGTVPTLRDLLFFKACCPRARLTGFGASLRNYPPATPEARRLADRIRPEIPVDLNDKDLWRLRFRPEEQGDARAWLEQAGGKVPMIAFSLGTKLVTKHWGMDNWHALIERLREDYRGFTLCALGAPAERSDSDALLTRWHGPTANACGEMTVRQSGALLALASVFIGHDSGPLHLASASGTPLIGIFSKVNHPGRWYPQQLWGGKIFYPNDAERSIGSTTPEMVTAALRPLLAS